MQFFSPWLSITVSKTINIFEKHIKELYKKKNKKRMLDTYFSKRIVFYTSL